MTTAGATKVFFVIVLDLVFPVLVFGFGVLLVVAFRGGVVALLLVGLLVREAGLRAGAEAVFVFVSDLLPLAGVSFLRVVLTIAESGVGVFGLVVLPGVEGPFLLCTGCFGLAVDFPFSVWVLTAGAWFTIFATPAFSRFAFGFDVVRLWGVLLTLVTLFELVPLEILGFPTSAGGDVFLVVVLFEVRGGWSALVDLAFFAVIVFFAADRGVCLRVVG